MQKNIKKRERGEIFFYFMINVKEGSSSTGDRYSNCNNNNIVILK